MMRLQRRLTAVGKSRFRRMLAVVTAVILLLILGAYAWGRQELGPVRTTKSAVHVDIRTGTSTAAIAQALESAGVIQNEWVFRIYLSLSHTGHLLQAGHYVFPVGLTAEQVVHYLTSGNVTSTAVHITIPEGYTVTQIANRLQQLHICTSTAFINEVQHGHFHETFLSQLSHSSKTAVKYRLEGYLFPDTYNFTRNESPHRVVDEMLQDFATHVSTPLMTDMQKANRSFTEIITVASIIEKEAKVSSERPIIASVIYNRLNRKPPMKLQMDATIEYILGHRNVVTDADLKVKDPYNTYVNEGLPPGPIASPGMASIRAALHPAVTQYLFYVVKNDGSGSDYFASTFAEQQQNITKSQANLQKYSAK